eukprot:Hpha_TRINITY_DN16339_c3_g5::TRINITY_DN16339_c3_g5_i1::g.59010::m.59010
MPAAIGASPRRPPSRRTSGDTGCKDPEPDVPCTHNSPTRVCSRSPDDTSTFELEKPGAGLVCLQRMDAGGELHRLKEELNSSKRQVTALHTALEHSRSEKLVSAQQNRAGLQKAREEWQREMAQLRTTLHEARSSEKVATEALERARSEFEEKRGVLTRAVATERRGKSELLMEYRSETEGLLEEQQLRIDTLTAAHAEEQRARASAAQQLAASKELLAAAEAARADAAAAHAREEEAAKRALATERRERGEESRRMQGESKQLRAEVSELKEQLRAAQEGLDHATAQGRATEQQLRSQLEQLNKEASARIAVEMRRGAQEAQALRDALQRATEDMEGKMKKLQSSSEATAVRLRRELEEARSTRQQAMQEHKAEIARWEEEAEERQGDLQKLVDTNAREAAGHARSMRDKDREIRGLTQRVAQLEEDLKEALDRVSACEEEHRAEQHTAAQHFETQLEAMRAEGERDNAALRREAEDAGRLSDEVRRMGELLLIAQEEATHAREDADRRVRRASREHAATVQRLQVAAGEDADTLAAMEAKQAALDEELCRTRLQVDEERRRADQALMRAEEAEGLGREHREEMVAYRLAERKLVEHNEEQRKHLRHLATALQDRELQLRAAVGDAAQARADLRVAGEETERLRCEMQEQSCVLEESFAEQQKERDDELRAVQLRAEALLGERAALAGSAQEERAKALQLRRELEEVQEEATEAMAEMREREGLQLRRSTEVSQQLRQHIGDLNAKLARARAEAEGVDTEAGAELRKMRAQLQDAQLQADLDRAEAAAVREELRARESIVDEKESVIALLQCRVKAKSSDVERLDAEVRDTSERLRDAEEQLARRTLDLTTLSARLKVAPA